MSEPTTTIYGSSDDLIVVGDNKGGALSEEFTAPDISPCGTGGLLAFSDGTVLNVHYDNEGVWRITLVAPGRCQFSIVQAPEDDEDNYSDRATLVGALDWCVLGSEIARAAASGETT